MASLFLLMLLFVMCKSVWQEIQGPFRAFLGSDGNNAEDYLVNNKVSWYQMKIRLSGTEYFVPLSIASQRIGINAFEWTLALPLSDIKTKKNAEQRVGIDKVPRLWGDPEWAQQAAKRSYMTIICDAEKYMARIDWVHSNKNYKGSDIMAIFMTILVRKNINFIHIGLTDTALKICPIPKADRYASTKCVSHSLFMAFIGRLNYFREWGFYVTDKRNRADRRKQMKYDEATKKLQSLRVREVIDAAFDDSVRDEESVKSVIDALIKVRDPKQIELMMTYMSGLSDKWGEQSNENAEKYMQVLEGLQSIPSIKRSYMNPVKLRVISMVWMQSELTTVTARLRAMQK